MDVFLYVADKHPEWLTPEELEMARRTYDKWELIKAYREYYTVPELEPVSMGHLEAFAESVNTSRKSSILYKLAKDVTKKPNRFLFGGRDHMNHSNSFDSERLAKSICEAILHARTVCLRDKHLDCRPERVNQFVVSLRRSFTLNSQPRDVVNDLCQTKIWLDAGVLEYPHRGYATSLEKYAPAIQVGVSMAKQQMPEKDISHELNELDIRITLMNGLTEQMKQINIDGEKVLDGVEQLVANM